MIWIRALISLALLSVLAVVIDVRTCLDTLRSASVPWLIPLLLVNTSAYVLFALRWGYFCRRLELPMTLGNSLRGVYLFQVTSQAVPSPLLGEAARFAVFPADVSKKTVLKSIVLDRLANQGSLLLLVTLLLPYYLTRTSYPTWLKIAAVVPGVLFVLGWIVARQGLWTLRRGRFLKTLFEDRGGLVPFSLGAILGLVLGIEFYVAARALELPTPPDWQLVLSIPLLLTATSLMPISFSDWGTREMVALVVLSTTGLGKEEIVSVSLMVGIANLVASLPGLFLLGRVRRRAPESELTND